MDDWGLQVDSLGWKGWNLALDAGAREAGVIGQKEREARSESFASFVVCGTVDLTAGATSECHLTIHNHQTHRHSAISTPSVTLNVPMRT